MFLLNWSLSMNYWLLLYLQYLSDEVLIKNVTLSIYYKGCSLTKRGDGQHTTILVYLSLKRLSICFCMVVW
jgi:hypothetical protein